MLCADVQMVFGISIHALREESDSTKDGIIECGSVFQSTLSVRRATFLFHVGSAQVDISIHALREESDDLIGQTGRIPFISIHALREESDASSWSRS